MTRAARWLDSVATPRRILWLGWLLVVVYSYPGYLSTDSVVQLLQARNQEPLADWYPPLMALVWRYLDLVIAGPFPMLVIQSTAMLLGLDAIFARVLAPRRAAIVAVCVTLGPPVLAVMAVIWKDSQMAGFLVAGLACLLGERRGVRIAGCLLLVLAAGMRYNAPAATLPLVVLVFQWRPDASRIRRYATALAVWLAITATALGVNRLVTQRETFAWHNSVAIFDIAGTIAHGPELSDDELRAHLPGLAGLPHERIQQRIREVYLPRAWYSLANDADRVIAAPQTPAERDAIAAAWRDLVTSYPASYLAHRCDVFGEVLGLSDDDPGAVWVEFMELDGQAAMIKHTAKHSKLQRHWIHLYLRHAGGMLFRPWVYLVLALAVLPLTRRNRLAFAVLASGLAYEASLFVSAPSADYRYSHWMIACAIVGAILVFVERWRRGRAVIVAQTIASRRDAV